ncbi:hypothetical protein HanRHA438_Chr12g0573061 [Helianthus annuus]|nr:hypothetical protein HanHA300_Chr12g0460881 [Helianthus annuus]KAJ0506805.1 hypothetical protein HanHA89_Chr12g0486281 [Helianthus annuus]KAJ0868299.1 hypothetical protein HanRHA438_Chr12g0573061 [Helianthus annuus]
MLVIILFLRIRTLVFNMPLFTTVPEPHILPNFKQVFPMTPTASVITSSPANTEHTRSRSPTSVPLANVFTQNTIPDPIKLQISSSNSFSDSCHKS